ncbi:MAG TPA: LysR family transcriptional regulator [Acidimicrobiia bacterium]|nr:LysR family transcriptional regulator [Acidimicrobiia bacterium]
MNIHDLELRHLVTFKEVAARRSFGKAAEELGFTQSAVSQQIARLESVLGQSLFRRPGGPKAVELTRAAEVLLPRVDGLIAGLRSIERDFAGIADGTVGRLSVGTFQSVSVRLLPAVITALTTERPELEVDLMESTSDAVLRQALMNHELDLTFWVDDDSDWSGFDVVRLFEDAFVVVAPADTAEDAYGPHQLASLPMIGQHLSDQCQGRIDAGLRSHGVVPRYVFRSGDNAAVQAMVRAGQGVAVMPMLSIDTSDPGVALRPLDPPLPPRVVVIVTRAGEKPSPAVERFIELAIEESASMLAGV